MPMFDFDKTVPYVKKSGIAGFFQLLVHNGFDLVLLNLLFILTSLPIVTVGASLTALSHMTLRMVQDEPTDFCRDYLSGFKSKLLSGIKSGLIYAAGLGITGFAFVYYAYLASGMPVLYAAALVSLSCFILVVFTFMYYFPMVCSVSLKTSAALKNSFLLALSYLGRTLLAFSVIALSTALIYAFFPYSLPFVCLGPVSISSLACSYAAWKPIQEHVIKK